MAKDIIMFALLVGAAYGISTYANINGMLCFIVIAVLYSTAVGLAEGRKAQGMGEDTGEIKHYAMREIKFRAWDGGKMIVLENTGLQYYDFEGSYALAFVVDKYDSFWAHEQYDTMSSKAQSFPLMQFTGLKDKSGADIYEGDIVRAFEMWTDENFNKTGEVMSERIAWVSWGDDMAGWRLISESFEERFLPLSHMDSFEIIGNIYENANILTP